MKINSSHRLSKLLLISSWIPATLASACADNTNKSANKSDTSTNTKTKPSNPKASESQTTPNNKTPETKPNSQQQKPPVNNQPAEDAEHMQSDQVQQHPQEQLKQVIVNLPFSESSTQYKVFELLTTKYNKWLENNDKAKKEGYFAVVTLATESYQNNLDLIKKQIKSQDPKTPNLSFGYGNDIYQVNQNHKLLNFAISTNTDNHLDAQSYNDDKLDKGLFEEKLLTDNSKIDGIDQSGLYLLPIGVSTDLLYISKPVVNHFLKLAIKAKKIQIASNDEEWFKTTFGVSNDNSSSGQDGYKFNDQSLTDSINSYYGNTLATTGTDGQSTTGPVMIEKDDFKSWTKLFKLINLMTKNFENTSKTNPSQFLASFNQTNLYELMSFMNEEANYSKFLWNRKDSTQNYNYDFLKNKESKEAKTLKNVYDLVAPAGKLGAYWHSSITDATPSKAFQKGHLAFMVGSNNLYKNLFDPSYFPNPKNHNPENLSLDRTDIFVTNVPVIYDTNTQNHPSFNVYSGGLYGIKSKDVQRDHATRLFVKWLSSDQYKLPLNNGSQMQNTEFNGLNFYSINSGYIPATKHFWDQYAQHANQLLQNLVDKTAFNLFTKFVKPNNSYLAPEDSNILLDKSTNNITPFVEPVGALTNAFRNVTNSIFSSDGKLPDFDSYWTSLTNNSEIQAYIHKNKS